MNFKDQVERDLTAVFHNSREHADVVEFWIDGIRYKGPVIICLLYTSDAADEL